MAPHFTKGHNQQQVGPKVPADRWDMFGLNSRLASGCDRSNSECCIRQHDTNKPRPEETIEASESELSARAAPQQFIASGSRISHRIRNARPRGCNCSSAETLSKCEFNIISSGAQLPNDSNLLNRMLLDISNYNCCALNSSSRHVERSKWLV